MFTDDDEDDRSTPRGAPRSSTARTSSRSTTRTAEDGPATGYVLVDGKHYLVKIENTEGDDPGPSTFSELQRGVRGRGAGDDEVVDLGSLMG